MQQRQCASRCAPEIITRGNSGIQKSLAAYKLVASRGIFIGTNAFSK